MSSALRVRAYAKINLSLRVLGVRQDGYHELRTILQSIALHDTLTVRNRRGPFTLQCDDPDCPADRRNLVWRAAERVWEASGRLGDMRDVEIRLAKSIPLQAGLGGGSSDAAAALRVLASLWHLKNPPLSEIAASLGADVPYFLEGGTVLGLDRGDVLYPLVDPPAAWITLVLPAFGVSTADAYAWWDAAGRNGGGPEPGNDLQGPVVAHHPEIARIVGALQKAGASHAAMSGSGSAVFGLFDRQTAAGRAARALLRNRRVLFGPGGPRSILVVRTVNRAAYQRLAGIAAHRINLPFAPRSQGHS
jgi:4-diphosphocytidyl-2-C-methyl-D-erythritol kinase